MTEARQREREANLPGALWEDICAALLDLAGWQIDERGARYDGLEADIIATNRHDVSVFFTCQGSLTGERPGRWPADAVEAAMSHIMTQARQGWAPHVVLTTHLPTAGRAGEVLREGVEQLGRTRLFDILRPVYEVARLQWLAQATEEEMRGEIMSRPSLTQVMNERKEGGCRPTMTETRDTTIHCGCARPAPCPGHDRHQGTGLPSPQSH